MVDNLFYSRSELYIQVVTKKKILTLMVVVKYLFFKIEVVAK
nr:hypothetical protein [Enterococcus faecalis]